MISSINVKYQTTACVFISVSSLLFFGYYLNNDFIKHNYEQAYQFVLSAHSFFFLATGALLYQKRITDKWYNYLVIITSVLYLLIFYGKYLDVFRMAGDNICQIAFWKILFHQNLAGSIGASFTKPGQLLILGPLYQMSMYLGPFVFKIGLSLVMAACIWSLTRIATDIGGRTAGIIVFPVSVWAFLFEFLAGSSSIFLIPSLFIGIWLYFYKPDYRNIGRILLVLSIQFHIHTITVLAAIWLIHLVKRDWRELATFSLYSILSVAFWVAIIYRVQGAMARLNSGVAVGYVAPLEGKPDNGLMYMLNILQDGLTNQPDFRVFVVLGVIGIIGVFMYGYKMYLTVFASLLVLVVNVVMLGGTFNLDRYCSTFYAFSCAVGVGIFVRYANDIRALKSLTIRLCTILTACSMMISLNYTEFNFYKEVRATDYGKYPLIDYIANATNILSDPCMAKSSRLMTEDDIIYSLVVMDAERFSSFTALQHFNVVKEPIRIRMLANTDYIWLALNNMHPYYYLSHMVDPAWQNDLFRMMIYDILRTNKPASLYGFRFYPVDLNEDRLILRVGLENTVK